MAQKGIVDFYKVLGVGEGADEAAIKKAYRGLVIKWHPDKNPAERQLAEEKIRAINAAYAVLSNESKRERYDLQRAAVDQRRRGIPRKPKVSPKMSTPKEFLLQPLGHTDKFIRCTGRRVSVQSRQDVEADFQEFFDATKFAMWWLPDMNNKCRIRGLGTKARGEKKGAAAGVAGGLNLAFRVQTNMESEVLLAPAKKGQKTDNVDFVAKESPEIEGALRFETACRRGHYLAFLPPTELRVVPVLDEDQARVMDFILVDFAATSRFKDLNEVLLPVCSNRGESWVPVAEMRDSKDVQAHFRDVLQKQVWDVEDFVAYFEGHWTDWEYRAEDQSVRLRPKEERLGLVLRSAQDHEEAMMAVARAGEELRQVSLPGAVRAVQLLSRKAGAEEEEGVPEVLAHQVAMRQKLLAALSDILSKVEPGEEGVLPMEQLIETLEAVPGLVGANPTPDHLDQRGSAVQLLLDLLATQVEKESPGGLRLEQLLRLLKVPGVSGGDEKLAELGAAACRQASRPQLLQVIKRAAARSCDGVAGAAAAAAAVGLGRLVPEEAAASLRGLMEAGAKPAAVAAQLKASAASLGTPALAAAVLALSEKTLSEDAARDAVESLAGRELHTLPTGVLLLLAVAAAKNAALGPLLGLVAAAAAPHLGRWGPEELVKLLLSAAKGKEHIKQDVREALLRDVAARLASDLPGMGANELLKVAVGSSGCGAATLLEAVAQEVTGRLQFFSNAQLLLLTQSLARGLPHNHAALPKLMEHWNMLLADAAAKEALLSPDQCCKLAAAASPLLAAEAAAGAAQGVAERFAEALGGLLAACDLKSASEESRALLEAELGERGGLKGCAQRQRLLAKLRNAGGSQPGGTAGPPKKKKRKR